MHHQIHCFDSYWSLSATESGLTDSFLVFQYFYFPAVGFAKLVSTFDFLPLFADAATKKYVILYLGIHVKYLFRCLC
jgi:hypothetical protein